MPVPVLVHCRYLAVGMPVNEAGKSADVFYHRRGAPSVIINVVTHVAYREHIVRTVSIRSVYRILDCGIERRPVISAEESVDVIPVFVLKV